MRPWLMRAARHAASGDDLPATLTLGDIPTDKAVRRALEEIFPGYREVNGRLKARLDPALRDRAIWLPLAELLGVRPAAPQTGPSPAERLNQAVRRLNVLFPKETSLIRTLQNSDHLLRYFRLFASAPDELVALFKTLSFLRQAPFGITLSELGAKFFNDSKALRNGALRQQLEHLLRLQSGDTDNDTPALLNACGIIENPYTTHAVVFAPFAYRTQDGAWLDWPLSLWQRGEAAILSWRSVRMIDAVRLEESHPVLVTSENAAPFHLLVERRQSALYTEGYPNAAVKTLLTRFADAGLSALHWGDTDLDGYRIAEQVSRCLPTALFSPPIRLPHERLLPLTPEQHHRLSQFIDGNPDFPYLAELRHTLAHGWLEQEQAMDIFPATLMPAYESTSDSRPATNGQPICQSSIANQQSPIPCSLPTPPH